MQELSLRRGFGHRDPLLIIALFFLFVGLNVLLIGEYRATGRITFGCWSWVAIVFDLLVAIAVISSVLASWGERQRLRSRSAAEKRKVP